MNFRGILFSSAATLVAVSGARAADAVMAPEPEPVEYVKVCDAYGAGFFYIPGTETCLRISGFARYQIGTTNDAGATPDYYGFTDGAWTKTVRARLNLDARSETEWGTLRSYIRFQATWNGGGVDGPVTTDQAWISLGGFRMGYSESAWVETLVGGVSDKGSHSSNGMSYGDQQRALIQYNFKSGGFYGVLSLEDDALAGEGYMPDVVGLVGYSAGWGGVWARLAYDESFSGTARPVAFGGMNDGGFGAAVGAQFNIPNMKGSSLRLIGTYSDGNHAYGVLHRPAATVFGGNGNAEWTFLASYNQRFTEKFSGSVGFQYFSDFYFGGTDIGSNLDGYSAELSFAYVPVKDFEIRTELHYDKIDTLDGSVSGYLRFQRSF